MLKNPFWFSDLRHRTNERDVRHLSKQQGKSGKYFTSKKWRLRDPFFTRCVLFRMCFFLQWNRFANFTFNWPIERHVKTNRLAEKNEIKKAKNCESILQSQFSINHEIYPIIVVCHTCYLPMNNDQIKKEEFLIQSKRVMFFSLDRLLCSYFGLFTWNWLRWNCHLNVYSACPKLFTPDKSEEEKEK